MCTFIYVNHIQFTYIGKSLVEEPGMCVKRYLDLGPSSGISVFQFEPSAVVLEEERNIILVGSLDEIIALPAGLPTDKDSIYAPIQVLHRFPQGSEDIEALQVVG